MNHVFFLVFVFALWAIHIVSAFTLLWVDFCTKGNTPWYWLLKLMTKQISYQALIQTLG
jgi:hypothetical protein